MKTKPVSTNKGPLEVVKQGSFSVPIYTTTNRIYRLNPSTGNRELKSEHPQFTVIHYEGSRRVKRKFADLTKARREADTAAIKLSNGEAEILKLKGTDRADYVHAMRRLREWSASVPLNLAITDYVAAVRRLPENTSLKEVVDFYLKRHPIGLPQKNVQEVVDELVESKEKSGKSEIYTRKMRKILGHFATAFNLRISLVTGRQVEDYIRGLGVGGRTQNNNRQLINTLFKFAIKRGYLPKDPDEMSAVELAENDSGEIQVFNPVELRKLFNACLTPVQERGKWRDREAMIPYLAIAAFCGLRSAEIARLDWSEVHLVGAEHFIEIKAFKAKTASRRTVPIPENCACWLAPFVKESGPVSPLQRPDQQCFRYLGPAAGLKWKHNGLRHSFISYRLALIKNVHQVSLEAGNSPQMVFKHYRQLVSETLAKEWFGIVPPKDWKNIAPISSNHIMKILILGILCIVVNFRADAQPDESGFVPVFDGKTLTGWHVSTKTGHSHASKNESGGRWVVEDGAIVGSQDIPANGGIIITDKNYSDFEVKLEMKNDFGPDSGLFLRSTEQGKAWQAMIDYHAGGNLMGIYGEGLGGKPHVRNYSFTDKVTEIDSKKTGEPPTALPVLPESWPYFWRHGQWNELRARIVSNPPHITTWINGVKIMEWQETEVRHSHEGGIALQVHGGGDYTKQFVRYRNIQVKELKGEKQP